MDELISRQAAIDALDCINGVEEVLRSLPSAEPTITHEQAIDYLHKTGWLQNHDRILTESKIVPPVQPKKGKWIPEHKRTGYNGYYKTAHYCSCCKDYYTTSPEEMNYCPNCGADMRGNEDGTD